MNKDGAFIQMIDLLEKGFFCQPSLSTRTHQLGDSTLRRVTHSVRRGGGGVEDGPGSGSVVFNAGTLISTALMASSFSFWIDKPAKFLKKQLFPFGALGKYVIPRHRVAEKPLFAIPQS